MKIYCVFQYLKSSCRGGSGPFFTRMHGDGTRGNKDKLLQGKLSGQKKSKKAKKKIRAIQHRNRWPTKSWELISSLEVLKICLKWALDNLVYGPAFKSRLDWRSPKTRTFPWTHKSPELSSYYLMVFQGYWSFSYLVEMCNVLFNVRTQLIMYPTSNRSA